MRYTIKYYCPKHKDVLLHEEQHDDSIIGFMMIREDSYACPKCRKQYFKSECVTRRANS